MTWQEWLKTEGAKDTLYKCALYIVKKYPWITDLLAEEDPEAIVGELWIHCQSNAEKWNMVRPLDSAENRKPGSIINWIITNFLKLMIDKTRTAQHFPRKYLYACIRKALTSDGARNIKTFIHKRATYYTCSEKLEGGYENCFNPQEDDYREWPFPKNVFLENIYQKETLICIAEFFCKEVKNRTGKALWIPVQQLLRYILSFIPVPERFVFESMHELNDEDSDNIESGVENDPEISTQYLDALDLSVEHLLTVIDIRKLAEKCAKSLDSNERKVLELYYHEEQFLKDVAEKLGYSGPSGVSYILEKARSRIRKFCERQPFLSPPGLDEKLFKSFMENLLMFCKNLSCDRSK